MQPTTTLPRPRVHIAGEMMETPFGSIHVETYGNPMHPSIVLLHGGAQSGRCWRKQIGTLSQRYSLIVPDLPGHGLTQVSSPITPKLLADSVHMVLDYYNLTERGAVLVGWSWGGMVIRNYLLAYGKEHVRGIVLTGTTLDFLEWFQRPEMQAVMDTIGDMFLSSDPQARTKAFMEFTNRLTYIKPEEDEYYLALGYNALCFFQGGLSPDLMQVVEDTQGDLYKGLPPTLIIQGQQDALCNVIVGREEHKRLAGSIYHEYSQCGHSAFLEHAEQFNHDLLAYMDALAKEVR